MFGLGLRHQHHKYVLQNNPKVDFFEVHTENFIAEGGAPLNFLSKISENYKISFQVLNLTDHKTLKYIFLNKPKTIKIQIKKLF